MTCFIIDDELHAINGLKSYVERTPFLELLGTSQEPLAALSHFQQTGVYPQITFLDVEMPELSGIELSGLLAGRTKVVLTTAHPGFAVAAFELAVSDYLLKPFSYQRFLKCVQKIHDQGISNRSINEETDDFFYIQTEGKGKLIKLFFKDLVYIESQKNYVSIVTADRKYLTYLTLTEISEQLPASFLRVSKSHIVNTVSIKQIEGTELILEGLPNLRIHIGAAYKESFLTHMNEHLIKSKRLPS